MTFRLAAPLALLLLLALPLPALATSRLIAAGDIAGCGHWQDSGTADLVKSMKGLVLALGDNAYPDGTAAQFANCYDPTWGQFKSRTRPVPGNHEYHTTGAAGYFGYFGGLAGPANGRGYYAFNRGAWRIYALNSERITSAQLDWLRGDLAAKPRDCVLAYWHRPLFSSGAHGNNPSVRPFYQALYDAGAEVVLTGHDHAYERFALLRPDGTRSRDGIRQFVVGTGGVGPTGFPSVKPHSQVRNSGTWGVLRLTLKDDGYAWKFKRSSGNQFSDWGTGTCR